MTVPAGSPMASSGDWLDYTWLLAVACCQCETWELSRLARKFAAQSSLYDVCSFL